MIYRNILHIRGIVVSRKGIKRFGLYSFKKKHLLEAVSTTGDDVMFFRNELGGDEAG